MDMRVYREVTLQIIEYISDMSCFTFVFREFVIVENIRQVCLLDLTAGFEVKTKTKLTPDCQLQEKEKLVFKALCTQ